ncbi:unnamed protein product, partial [Penicillium discolor]
MLLRSGAGAGHELHELPRGGLLGGVGGEHREERARVGGHDRLVSERGQGASVEGPATGLGAHHERALHARAVDVDRGLPLRERLVLAGEVLVGEHAVLVHLGEGRDRIDRGVRAELDRRAVIAQHLGAVREEEALHAPAAA